ncbi:MAG: FlgD immunoglobulin-like domain containing protein [Candidatus Krumholzibacteriia bacterium]
MAGQQDHGRIGAGRLIKRLHEGKLTAGEHTAAWDGRDRQGRQQPSGVYMARLETSSLRLSCRLTLVQ